MIKTVLITGGSGGIGKQTAISLAKEGFHIIITGRSLKSCSEAVAEIKNKSTNENVDYIISDFNSLKSIQALADEYKKKHSYLDILVNNVGVLKETKEFTDDGIEKNFAINVLVPYLLSILLFDLLVKSKSGKIISLIGGMPLRKIDFQNLQAEKNYLGVVTYSQSKMVMMTLMFAFGKTFDNTNVTSNFCYPGQASTAMTNALTPKMFPWFLRIFSPIFSLFKRDLINDNGKSAERASQSTIYLAISPQAQMLHNSYINYKNKKTDIPKLVLNAHNQHHILKYANQIINDRLGINIS